MIKYLYLSIGGVAGASLRYFASNLMNSIMGLSFPYGTLLVNLSGSFMIGLLWGLSEILIISPNMRIFLFVGFLGSFTTFSTFALENLNYMRDNNVKIAIWNILISNLAGLALVFLGFLISKYLITINN